jgi:hypothetical protein
VFNASVNPKSKLNSTLLAAIAVLAAAALPAAAQAKITEIGDVTQPGTPSCPTNPCLAMTRTTGYQAKVGPTRGTMIAPASGRIVAFTLALGATNTKQTQFFQQRFGGEPQARLTILRVGKHLFDRVVAQSEVFNLADYLGQTVQFPLSQSLPVAKGQLVALTVPTWAPVLAVGLPRDTSWRASRKGACNDIATQSLQTAQTSIGSLTQYRCLYATARLTYSATLIPNPTPNKKPSSTKKPTK